MLKKKTKKKVSSRRIEEDEEEPRVKKKVKRKKVNIKAGIKDDEEETPKKKRGRPKGIAGISNQSKELIEAAQATGELPHEFLLRVCRGGVLDNGYIPTWEERINAAKAAAPYFAPKLAAVSVTDSGGSLAQFFNAALLSGLNQTELAVIEKVLAFMSGQKQQLEEEQQKQKALAVTTIDLTKNAYAEVIKKQKVS